jgi:hypothetical protein
MVELGRLAGLRLTAKPSAVIGMLVLWVVFAAAGLALGLPLVTAVLGGLAATALHWLSELVHQLGHAWAARRTGFPMIGIRFWGVLSTTIYPRDEPALPANIHIRRALGGPLASTIMTLLGAVLLPVFALVGGVAWLLALFFTLENLLVFTAQVFVPLGFNDGSTILYWWRRRGTALGQTPPQ